MQWDKKLVYYLLLTYFMYGLFSWPVLRDFVVPLPMSFIFTIVVVIVFLIKTELTIFSLFYLTIPLLIFKDLIMYENPVIGKLLTQIGIFSYIPLAIIIYIQNRKNWLLILNSLLFLLSPILLFNNVIISLSLIAITTLITFRNLNSETQFSNPLKRVLLMTFLINTLFLLNELSIWLVTR